MTIITAETVLSSKHASLSADKRLTTMIWTYPRWIHAEGRTHRLLSIDEEIEIMLRTPSPMQDPNLSRNASSSRALPVKKMIQDVIDHPAVPIFWGKNIGGMQANEELTGAALQAAKDNWFMAMEAAIKFANAMTNLLGTDDEGQIIGVHKQIVNRLLEPFSHIRVVASATEWSNFLWLRDHKDAEPHIHLLAEAVRAELDKPAMQILHPGEWHLPFVEVDDWSGIYKAAASGDQAIETAKKLSVARCASVSYKTVDGFDMTQERANALYDKLVSSDTVHASPFEHQGQADELIDIGETGPCLTWMNLPQNGNFVGFRQLRKMIPNEAR